MTEDTIGEMIIEALEEFLVTGHSAVIQFPIIGVIMGLVAVMTALIIAITLNIFNKRLNNHKEIIQRYINRFEFASALLVLMGIFSLIIAGVTGLNTVGTMEGALTQEILTFKVKLTIYAFFMLMSPLGLKLLLSIKYQKSIFSVSKIIPLLYITPLLIASVQIMLLSGSGAMYLYGHSILDTLGLSWLYPYAE